MAKQTFTTGQVLTAAQMTSLQQTAMLGGAASAKTASYTLVAADAGTAISMDSASATTITVNTALFAAGDTVQITNLGAGVCTITAGTATVNTSASLALAQYESGTLDFTSTSAAIFIKGAGAGGGGGSMTVLASGSITNTALSLTSIDQTYIDLYLYLDMAKGGTAGAYGSDFRFNSNTGSVYSNVRYALVNGGPIGAVDSAGTSGRIQSDFFYSGTTFQTTMNIYQYANSTAKKIFDYNTIGFDQTANLPLITMASGMFNSTAAITSIQTINTALTGSYILYGVK